MRLDIDLRQKRINKIRAELAKMRPSIMENAKCCEICGCKYEKYYIHHIKPISDLGDNSPDNLVVVCEKCHKAFHSLYATYESNYKRLSQKINNLMGEIGVNNTVKIYQVSHSYTSKFLNCPVIFLPRQHEDVTLDVGTDKFISPRVPEQEQQ